MTTPIKERGEFWTESVGIKCPYCKSQQVTITDSRPNLPGRKRRYTCYTCKKRFGTQEVVKWF